MDTKSSHEYSVKCKGAVRGRYLDEGTCPEQGPVGSWAETSHHLILDHLNEWPDSRDTEGERRGKGNADSMDTGSECEGVGGGTW